MIDPIVYFQSHILHIFMFRHKLSPGEFLELDSKYDLLGFMRLGYESFRLTDDKGVVDEIDNYISCKKNMI